MIKRLIYIVPILLLVCNTVNRLNIITPDEEWMLAFAGEDISTLIIILVGLFYVKGKVKICYIYLLVMYSFESFNEIIDQNHEGTTLTETYYYLLITFFIIALFLIIKYEITIKKYQWTIKNIKKYLEK